MRVEQQVREIRTADIEGFENYSVTEDGRIWSKPRGFDGTRKTAGWHLTGRYLSQFKKKNGYMQVGLLGNDGKRKYFTVHRLVAEAFIGKPKPGQVTNHKNGNKADNRLENLEWVTVSENSRHAIDILGKQVGRLNGNYRHGRYVRKIRINHDRED